MTEVSLSASEQLQGFIFNDTSEQTTIVDTQQHLTSFQNSAPGQANETRQ